MAIDYPAAQRHYRKFKTRLTKAEHTKDPHAILRECASFFAYYERADTEPFPDGWHRWERAREDAYWIIRRQAAGL